MLRSYLTLQHKLLPSFDTQQDAFLVFNLRLFHSNNLLHRQQVLLWRKLIINKPKQLNAENGTSWVNLGLQEITFLHKPTHKTVFWSGPRPFLALKLSQLELVLICICWSFMSPCMILWLVMSHHAT